MATFTGTNGADVANATSATLTGFTGGTVAELQDATGDIFIGLDGADTVVAGAGADTIRPGLGVDTARGQGGNDIIQYNSNAEIGTDVIDGGAISGGTGDHLLVAFTGAVDFRTAQIASTGTTSIETLALTGGGQHFVEFNAAQISATGLASNLRIQGDAGGLDVVRFNNARNLNLSTFTFATWGAGDRVFIAGGDLADTLTGTSIDDTLEGGLGGDYLGGGAGADSLYGGAAGDTLDGGAGDDFISYAAASEIANDVIEGGAGIDILEIAFTGVGDFSTATISSPEGSIERLELYNNGHDIRFNASQVNAQGLALNLVIAGAAGTDLVTFNNATNLNLSGFTFATWDQTTDRIVVNGGAGGGTIVGTSVADTINAGAGSDIFTGGAGNDILNGEDGGDFIDGAAGADAMNGGAEFDTVSWLSSAPVGTGLTVNLNNQAQNAGAALGDTLSNFENYYLTNAGDTFTNNGSGGYIYGFAGVDTINGGAGVDIIDGGDGADTLDGGAGFDYVSWNSSTTGITVNLNNQTQNAGGAAGDRVSNFEEYFLTEQNDIFTGVNNGASIVFGFAGADTLTDGTGSNAWLFGGDGADVLTGGALNDLLSGEAGADIYHYNSWVGEGFDSVLNFTTGADKFRFTASGFGLSAGATLTATNFKASAAPAATAAAPTFLYNTTLGILSFDLDGTGTNFTATPLAQIANAPTLATGDFLFV